MNTKLFKVISPIGRQTIKSKKWRFLVVAPVYRGIEPLLASAWDWTLDPMPSCTQARQSCHCAIESGHFLILGTRKFGPFFSVSAGAEISTPFWFVWAQKIPDNMKPQKFRGSYKPVTPTPEHSWAQIHLYHKITKTQPSMWYKVFLWPDSMAQWQDCRPECWEAWGPEFNPRPGRVGVRFLSKLGQPPKTFISYSLLSVAH